MNTKLQAAQDLKKLSNQLRGIIAIGDDLEQFGRLEEKLNEMESRLKVAEEKEKEFLLKAENANKTYLSISDQIKIAENEVNKMKESINAEAKSIIESAKDKANVEAMDIIQKAKNEVKSFETIINNKKEEIAKLNTLMSDKIKQFDDLTNKIAQLKQQIRNI